MLMRPGNVSSTTKRSSHRKGTSMEGGSLATFLVASKVVQALGVGETRVFQDMFYHFFGQ